MHMLPKTLGVIASLAILDLASASPITPRAAGVSIPLISNPRRVYLPQDFDVNASGLNVQIDSPSQKLFYDKSEFLVELALGSDPPQPFYFVLDTGSSVMWVYSNGCPEEQCKHGRFNSVTQSSTFKTNGTLQIAPSYEDGSVTVGYVGQDTVRMGSFEVKDQEFVVVDQGIDVLKQDDKALVNSVGLLGLGYSIFTETRDVDVAEETSKTEYTTFFSNLKNSNAVPNGMFSVYLGPNTDRGDSGGHLYVGGYDRSAIDGTPQYVKTFLTHGVAEDWALYAEGFTLFTDQPQPIQEDGGNKQTVFQSTDSPPPSMNVVYSKKFPQNVNIDFDTGSEKSYFYPEYADAIYHAITQKPAPSKDGNWPIECKHQHSKVILRTTFSHNHMDPHAKADCNPLYLDVPIKNLITQDTDRNCWWSPERKDKDDERDSGNMMFSQDYLRNFYLVLDYENKQLGLAVPKGHDSRVILGSVPECVPSV